jgi:hypothetical protein
MIKKTKNPKETARTTIASINKEMQRPRLTESVRSYYERAQAAPVVERFVRSERV